MYFHFVIKKNNHVQTITTLDIINYNDLYHFLYNALFHQNLFFSFPDINAMFLCANLAKTVCRFEQILKLLSYPTTPK